MSLTQIAVQLKAQLAQTGQPARTRKPAPFCRMAKAKQTAIREMIARIKLEGWSYET